MELPRHAARPPLKLALVFAGVLALAGCTKKEQPPEVDAGPKVIDLEKDRVVPCGSGDPAVCAREWARGRAAMSHHLTEPRWVCPPKASSVDVYFAPRPDAADLGLAVVTFHDDRTIGRRVFFNQHAPDPALKCTERPPAEAGDDEPAPESLARPPSLVKSLKAATDLVTANQRNGGGVPAGTCTRQLSATGCEANLGSSRWILFSGQRQTFFVRVDASLHARFDDPYPDSSRTEPMPWATCGCEDLPGFRVGPERDAGVATRPDAAP